MNSRRGLVFGSTYTCERLYAVAGSARLGNCCTVAWFNGVGWLTEDAGEVFEPKDVDGRVVTVVDVMPVCCSTISIAVSATL